MLFQRSLSQSTLRHRVLSLYKRVISIGHKWENKEESADILQEAKTLFRKNKHIADTEEIQAKIFEAESRLELALHYKIPYPRYFNVGPRANAKNGKRFRIPAAYMDSLYPSQSQSQDK